MRYRARPGVVLTEICGESFLVAAAALREECPFVTPVNDTTAFLWNVLIHGADIEALELAAQEEYEIEDSAAAKAAIMDMVEALLAQHLLICQEAEE